jgi:hypothetical protein
MRGRPSNLMGKGIGRCRLEGRAWRPDLAQPRSGALRVQSTRAKSRFNLSCAFRSPAPSMGFCVVALIRLDRTISAAARGILERNGLAVIEFDTTAKALRALQESVQVHAIILEAHRRVDADEEDDIRELLAVAAAPPWGDAPIQAVIVTSRDVAARWRPWSQHRAHIIWRARFTYRQASLIVLRLCGMQALHPQPPHRSNP